MFQLYTEAQQELIRDEKKTRLFTTEPNLFWVTESPNGSSASFHAGATLQTEDHICRGETKINFSQTGSLDESFPETNTNQL